MAPTEGYLVISRRPDVGEQTPDSLLSEGDVEPIVTNDVKNKNVAFRGSRDPAENFGQELFDLEKMTPLSSFCFNQDPYSESEPY